MHGAAMRNSIVSCTRMLAHSPLSTAPYQTDDFAPSLTSPMTLAFGAMKTSAPLAGITMVLTSTMRRMMGTGAAMPWPGGVSGSCFVGAQARLGLTACNVHRAPEQTAPSAAIGLVEWGLVKPYACVRYMRERTCLLDAAAALNHGAELIQRASQCPQHIAHAADGLFYKALCWRIAKWKPSSWVTQRHFLKRTGCTPSSQASVLALLVF